MKIRAKDRKTGKEAAKTAASNPVRTTILLGGKRMVVPVEEARLMEAAGTEFANLCIDKKTGRTMTVPVNG